MKHKLSVDRLQPGIFISISELGWLDHPFLLNRFRLADEEQIKVLRSLGLKEVEWDPARSTVQPLPETTDREAEEEIDFSSTVLTSMLDAKRERSARVRQQREGLARSERLFEQEATGIGEILRDLGARPAESYGRAKSAVGRLVGSLLNAESVAVHLVNMKVKEPGLAHHAMNVVVLSLLLGKAAQLGEEEMRWLGLGCMFHDLGKIDVPTRVLRNSQRTAAEEQFYQAHVGYGIKHVAKLGELPVPVKNVIACHHERWDGKGFPNHLAGAKIPRLARIAAIANRYDNLCNPFDLKTAKTPSEAVSFMFRQEKDNYDPELLQLFVKAVGVYPPGCFVALSDGSVGLVVETNSGDLLHPLIMLYDASVPRNEALLLDLRETESTIEAAISPAKLPVEVVEYLAPRGRIDYYIEGVH
ncbi:phosphohydrolase [Dechloromonas denitrificans]|uniref:Phosphohydrolase n=1 Tax=Dechloromonas denitrificans TaxID=281362 RepID=A0A133XH33_9RHOO|nr:HD-GYP domain-containing protein [Dechloromonas denitrificans]KXB30254.1 phosphohydrolase [Dechloromonas denitrificans]